MNLWCSVKYLPYTDNDAQWLNRAKYCSDSVIKSDWSEFWDCTKVISEQFNIESTKVIWFDSIWFDKLNYNAVFVFMFWAATWVCVEGKTLWFPKTFYRDPISVVHAATALTTSHTLHWCDKISVFPLLYCRLLQHNHQRWEQTENLKGKVCG